jgi:hypothetical protein
MPESEGDSDFDGIVAAVESGADDISVPQELIDEPDEPPPPAARSLYAQILTMSVAAKIKLALRGNKDARMILIRDTNKMIRRLIMLNPRISDAEVISVCRNRSADEELLRLVSERREWMRNYQVRLSLCTNPKTPIVIALRQLTFLSERDLRTLAKSKNVTATVSAQARRMVLTMKGPG